MRKQAVAVAEALLQAVGVSLRPVSVFGKRALRNAWKAAAGRRAALSTASSPSLSMSAKWNASTPTRHAIAAQIRRYCFRFYISIKIQSNIFFIPVKYFFQNHIRFF